MNEQTTTEQGEKPEVAFVGEDGNVFAITGRCGAVLKRLGRRAEAGELYRRVSAATSYDEALSICQEYVEFV